MLNVVPSPKTDRLLGLRLDAVSKLQATSPNVPPVDRSPPLYCPTHSPLCLTSLRQFNVMKTLA
ncbi:hypothetical protein BDN72DRAFT_845757 [Pluteus cervinus]|uniref:Uncharacterized protein n=1 Tax=Pluteus cervinus TaxID=181527 RepID=A0ACD3AI41_9AGAR|nr:hypothetical protein BDN72DRAFT_845757 [Pluteus cervinus]